MPYRNVNVRSLVQGKRHYIDPQLSANSTKIIEHTNHKQEINIQTSLAYLEINVTWFNLNIPKRKCILGTLGTCATFCETRSFVSLSQ